MKKWLVVLLGLLVISVASAEEKKPKKKLNPRLAKIKTIAVLPVEVNLTKHKGSNLVVSKMFTEAIKESLFDWQYDDYKIVERDNMEQILDELKFQMSGVTNPETAKKLGHLLNVDGLFISILTGDVVGYSEMTYKLVEVETGEIVWIKRTSSKMPNPKSPGYLYSQALRGLKIDFVPDDEEKYDYTGLEKIK